MQRFSRADLEPFLNYISYLYHLDSAANKARSSNFKHNNVNTSIFKDVATVAFISARFCSNNLNASGFKRPDKLINLWQAVCGPKHHSDPQKLDIYKFLIPKEKNLNLVNFPLQKGLKDAFNWSGKQRITTLKRKESNIEEHHKNTMEMFQHLYGYASEIGYDWKVIISECHATKNCNKKFPYSESQKNINEIIHVVKENAQKKKKALKNKRK